METKQVLTRFGKIRRQFIPLHSRLSYVPSFTVVNPLGHFTQDV